MSRDISHWFIFLVPVFFLRTYHMSLFHFFIFNPGGELKVHVVLTKSEHLKRIGFLIAHTNTIFSSLISPDTVT